MTDYVPVLVALIAGPIAAVVTARLSRPKVRADATKILTDVSISLVRPQKERIADLEQQIGLCRRQIDRLEKWAHRLAAQVIENGATPIRLEDVDP